MSRLYLFLGYSFEFKFTNKHPHLALSVVRFPAQAAPGPPLGPLPASILRLGVHYPPLVLYTHHRSLETQTQRAQLRVPEALCDSPPHTLSAISHTLRSVLAAAMQAVTSATAYAYNERD
ncbi:hypothetical protein B0H19DRAFT_1271072 [Mycena capillaripes]|nr:hypothetical protein B0H19DRAFT_1271072 [Mycena capillaripes]